MEIKCTTNICIYNKDNICTRANIEIEDGNCRDFIIPKLSNRVLNKGKAKTLSVVNHIEALMNSEPPMSKDENMDSCYMRLKKAMETIEE